ncbi:hypothetical protein HQ535_02480 [bacterium]|nr:hypothetical protein [bacterium]
MPDHDVERALADCFEAAVLTHLGAAPNGREEHDGPPPRLRVDFTYSTPAPGAALEISDIAWRLRRAANSARDRLEDRLNDVARDEELGEWEASLTATDQVRKLEPLIAGLMQSGEEIDTHELENEAIEAIHANDQTTYRALTDRVRQLNALGLTRLWKEPGDDHGFTVGLFMSRLLPAHDLGNGLADRIDAKSEVLREARQDQPGRVTHLLVRVTDGRVSKRDLETPPPLLPDSIDYLWVILRILLNDEARGLWIRRGDAAWSEFAEQIGPLPETPG